MPSQAVRSGETPLYEQTVAQWESLGRTVPGRPDPEWDRLTAGPGQRRRVLPSPRRQAA
ncbi:hypothetical protein [Streptacidiphilus neutrinimicus]|uniref:hypothetical protein n=1 Tax=Streptacidiphilus neutrinimicus TaxID=105420 RepID=UPI000AADECBE|nr:hypothetical protein [Streptacidiphilus neutrinimicus]